MKPFAMTVLACGLAAGALADNAKEEAALKERVAKFEAAWNTHDAKQIAAFWAVDGDLVNPGGIKASGRAEVEKLIASDLATIIRGATTKMTLTAVRFVKPDVAILDLTHDMSGVKGPDGAEMPAVKALVTGVAQRTGGTWWWVTGRPMIPFAPPAGVKPAAAAAPASAAPGMPAGGAMGAAGMMKK